MKPVSAKNYMLHKELVLFFKTIRILDKKRLKSSVKDYFEMCMSGIKII